MGSDFVTIATYDIPPPAHLALGLLRESGIYALLRNEELVAGAWDLGQASRGVEVRVPEADAQRAQEIVEQARFHGGVDTFDGMPAEDDAVPPPTPRECEDLATANRALRAAVFGILFFPLQVYSFWLLFELSERTPPDRRTPLTRRRMRTALLLDLGVTCLLGGAALAGAGAAVFVGL